MAREIKVTFIDGREETVKVFALAQVQAEEHMGALTAENDTRYGYYLAWSALKQSKRETREFLAWVADIDEIEILSEKEAVPTQEAQSSDTSSI